MADRRWLGTLLGCMLGASPPAVCAETVDGASWLEALQSGHSRLYELLAQHFRPARRKRPEWLVELSQEDFDPDTATGSDAAHLVVQQDRRDGADLLTLRRALIESGAVRAYAGAGLSRATYYEQQRGVPELLSQRDRHRTLGPAAELGAEFRVSERLLLGADLRWTEFDDEADLLRGEDGPLSADPLALGLSVGWRFR